MSLPTSESISVDVFYKGPPEAEWEGEGGLGPQVQESPCPATTSFALPNSRSRCVTDGWACAGDSWHCPPALARKDANSERCSHGSQRRGTKGRKDAGLWPLCAGRGQAGSGGPRRGVHTLVRERRKGRHGPEAGNQPVWGVCVLCEPGCARVAEEPVRSEREPQVK